MADSSIKIIESGPVLLERHANGIAHVRLNRPDSANGLDMALLEALNNVILKVHGDSQVRSVLITGAGRNFCAGGDVHAFLAKGEDLPYYIREATRLLQSVAAGLLQLNPPVVSAVQGFAAGGGGMGLVCSSDFVVAGESTKFLAGATRVAMVPDAGVSVTLTQLVGFRRAMEILMLNPTLTAAEAKEIGLITRVVPDDVLFDEAYALAKQLAAGAPKALANTKRLLWRGIGQSVDAAMPEENYAQEVLSGTADAREGLAAVIENRAPKFTGR